MSCNPKDVALKALFLGPQAENAVWLEDRVLDVLRHWIRWRRTRFPADGPAITAADREGELYRQQLGRVENRLRELLHQLEGESPKFTPRYLGHMMSELALPALLGHVAVLLHNPNLTTAEASCATSPLEREGIDDLLQMVGMKPGISRGHFTSGGTLANLEALWRALFRWDRAVALAMALVEQGREPGSELAVPISRDWRWIDAHASALGNRVLEGRGLLAEGPFAFGERYQALTGRALRSPLVLVPAHRHFSWPKAVTLLGLGTEALRSLPLDGGGRLDLGALRGALRGARGDGRAVLAVISVLGTTGAGCVDAVGDIQDLLDEHRRSTGEAVWHHVDAAYGGYFCSMVRGPAAETLGPGTRNALRAVSRASSVTLDPHKLGFVPYACGALLVREPEDYRSPSFDAPYLARGPEEAWQNTIEGSRAATGAVATWLAGKTIGLDADGYGRILQRGLAGAKRLKDELTRLEAELCFASPVDLNILCFYLARSGETFSSCNRRTEECYRRFRQSPNFSVSKTELRIEDFSARVFPGTVEKGLISDTDRLVCLRVVVMNPFFSSRETHVRYEELFVKELAAAVRGDP